jgi:hypothetical protein
MHVRQPLSPKAKLKLKRIESQLTQIARCTAREDRV